MLRMVVLENYLKNEILENEILKIGKNYLKIEVKIGLFENSEFWKLNLKIRILKSYLKKKLSFVN